MKNYVISNVSTKSHTTIKYTMKMLSSSCETVIFMLMGVATVHNHHEWNTYFVLFTLLFCSLFRAIGVAILAGLVNRVRVVKIAGVEKFVMMYGGLRGAVAFALVLLIDPHHVPQQQMFLTTTITVVYFTVFIQGMTIKPLVDKLGVRRSNKRKLTMNERIHERSLDHIMAGIEDIVGHPGRYYMRDMFKHFNHKYLRPLLTHEDTSRDPKIMETFSKLALRDAMKTAVDDVINGGSKSARDNVHAVPSWGDIIRDNSNWNLSHLDPTYLADMSQVRHNPSMKDLNDATIHHLLDDDPMNPYQRRRRWSYSRHAVNDEDMHTRPVNHTMQLYMRRRMIDMYRRKKLKNQNGSSPRKNVTFATNGSAVRLQEDNLYDVVDTALSVDERGGGNVNNMLKDEANSIRRGEGIVLPIRDEEDLRHITETESVLPWKRDDEVLVCHRPLKWHNTSAPAWISNEDYTNYASPPESMFMGENIDDSEEGLRSRRSSLSSSFRAGFHSLRSSLRRHFTASQHQMPVTVTVENTNAICEETQMTPAPPDGSVDNPETAKSLQREDNMQEGGRRNFTAVSIEGKAEGDQERSRL